MQQIGRLDVTSAEDVSLVRQGLLHLLGRQGKQLL